MREIKNISMFLLNIYLLLTVGIEPGPPAQKTSVVLMDTVNSSGQKIMIMRLLVKNSQVIKLGPRRMFEKAKKMTLHFRKLAPKLIPLT